MTRPGEPPVDYLRECSSTSLRYFEISKLEHVANLRRELTVLLEEMTEEAALALFARWMLEGRSMPPGASRSGNAAKSAESGRAQDLMAEFISNAVFPGESRTGASGSAGRSRGEGKSLAEGVGGPAMDLAGVGRAAAEQSPPQRGDAGAARSMERRLERRAPRGSRGSRRLVDQAH